MADNTQLNTGTGGDIISTDVITTLNGAGVATGEKAQRVKVGWGVDATFNDTNASNPLPVVQTGTPGLPTGASTAAKQPALGTAGGASADVLSVQGVASMTALKVDGSAVTQPVSGTVTANAGSGTMAVSLATNTPTLQSGSTTAVTQATATNLKAQAENYQGGTAVGSANPLQVTLANTAANATAVKVDNSAVTQPVSGTVTANAGTNLNTSALALETGGNLASIKTDVDNLNLAQGSTTSGQKGNLGLGAVTTAAPTYTTAQSSPLSLDTSGNLRVAGTFSANPPSSVTSSVNSTTSNLSGAAAFTGTGEDVSNYAAIQVSVFSSHVSATDGLSLQQSSDNTNWDITDVYTIPATTGKVFSVQPAAKYFRLVYTNGATLTTSLRIQTVYHYSAPNPSSQRTADAYTNETDLTQEWAFNSLYNGTTWDRMRGDITNGLDVDVTRMAALVAGSAIIGKVGIDQTTPGTTNLVALAANQSVNTAQVNGVTTLTGNGATGTGSQRVTIASDNTVLPGVGAGATGSSVPANASYKGLLAQTANPTAATAGNLVGSLADKLGKQVVVGSIRDLKANQVTTITASVAETTIVTAVASTFLDLYGIIITNTSATAVNVAIKDSTAGTTRFNIAVPAGDTRGFMLPESAAIKQTTVNTNWTATSSASVTSLVITALTVANI